MRATWQFLVSGFITVSVVAFTPIPSVQCGRFGQARGCEVFASAKGDSESAISFDAIEGKCVLVVGGSGRVGGSVVTQLMKRGAKVTVGGTNPDNFEISRTRWQEMFSTIDMSSIKFASLNRESSESVTSVIRNEAYDLVVHTAGPFQGKATVPNGVIDACVTNSVPYIDVCDDYCTASAAKSRYFKQAEDAEVPCIISTGCWVSFCSITIHLVYAENLDLTVRTHCFKYSARSI
jgi:short subunit dehydrogenase-like uncharacterized protein